MRVVAALALTLAACGSGSARVVVAAGTTVVDSGIADDLAAAFEAAHHGIDVLVVGEATLSVLGLARSGAAEILITHAPAAEARFLAEGGAAEYRPIMESRFLLLAPAGSVLSPGLPPEDAFARIAGAGASFITRADGSGTAEAEAAIWAAAGIEPSGPWYEATGLGMAETIQVADQREAFVLAEEGAFLEMQGAVGLMEIPLAASPLLVNTYHATLVAGASTEAGVVFRWLFSDEGRDALASANQDRFGRQVYRR